MKKRKKKRNFFAVEYNSESTAHNFLFILTAFLLIAAIFAVRARHCDSTYCYIAFEKDAYIWQSPYIKQTDAFLKGQLHLDATASKELLSLENPYDPSARAEAGAAFLWDHAFYNGRYYSYFGVAPILTVHLPIYLVTGGLPSDEYAAQMLAVYAVIFLALAYREVLLRFVKKVNLWLFLLGLCAFTVVSGVYTAVLIADFYYLPVLSALGCTMAFVFYALRAVRKNGCAERRTLLALAAISLTFAVLSRPSASLMCLGVSPIFAELFLKKERGERRKNLSSLCFFALPLAVLACAVMWYNSARFSSPFDFGEKYQLTVSDVSKNTLEPGFAFSAFFSYFLYPFWEKSTYPFIGMQGQLVLPDGARYVYGDLYVGAFALVLPAAALLYPGLARREREAGEADPFKNTAVLATAVLSVAVAFADFCRGGVNMRYIYDIVPMLSIVGVTTLLGLTARFSGAKKICCSLICTVAFAFAVYAGVCVAEAFLP